MTLYILLWGPANPPGTARQQKAADLQPLPSQGSPFSASMLTPTSHHLLGVDLSPWRELWLCEYKTGEVSMLLPASIFGLVI